MDTTMDEREREAHRSPEKRSQIIVADTDLSCRRPADRVRQRWRFDTDRARETRPRTMNYQRDTL
ncbi:unnamed protein product, partial [Cylicostephanus goldi]